MERDLLILRKLLRKTWVLKSLWLLILKKNNQIKKDLLHYFSNEGIDKSIRPNIVIVYDESIEPKFIPPCREKTMTNQIKKMKTNLVSNIVFGCTLGIVLISLIPLFFPAFFATLDKNFKIYVDPFETGAFALPVLITNVITFSFLYLYLSKKLPDKLYRSIKFIFKFEISRRIATIVIVILLGGYVAFTVQDLSIDEFSEWPDFKNIQLAVKDFPYYGDAVNPGTRQAFIKNFLLYSSQTVFDNIKILPFISSITLLLLTYFFTLEISKKRFAGIIAMIILLQSYIFLRYDTVATYSNFWTLFFVLSLYMIHKRWYLSPVSYFLSIFSKPLAALYFPLALFFTYRASIPKKKKIRIALTYIITAVILLGTIAVLNTSSENVPYTNYLNNIRNFNVVDFSSGLSAWAIQFRFDVLIMLFILPVTVGLFLVSRKGILEADSILVLILGFLVLTPLLPAFTSYNVQPYRFLPLVVFFAVGVGTILSKRITQ